VLYATTTPAQKRANLRERLTSGDLLQFPGGFNPLSAKLIERHRFDGVYISGAVLSADLALPDIGLTTLSEVAARTHQIARVTELPALADADTGFGEPINVARAVQELEDSGLAALHIEDQINPKRCGHLDGKQVVDEATDLIKLQLDGHRFLESADQFSILFRLVSIRDARRPIDLRMSRGIGRRFRFLPSPMLNDLSVLQTE